VTVTRRYLTLGRYVILLILCSYFFVHVEPLFVYVPSPPALYLVSKSLPSGNSVTPNTVFAPPKVTLLRVLQFVKAVLPISLTPLPIVTLLIKTHLLKAIAPILVTLSGMITLLILVLLSNALLAISVTGRLLYEEGITTSPSAPVPLLTLYPLPSLVSANSSPAVPAAAGADVADPPFVHAVLVPFGLVYVPAVPLVLSVA